MCLDRFEGVGAALPGREQPSDFLQVAGDAVSDMHPLSGSTFKHFSSYSRVKLQRMGREHRDDPLEVPGPDLLYPLLQIKNSFVMFGSFFVSCPPCPEVGTLLDIIGWLLLVFWILCGVVCAIRLPRVEFLVQQFVAL